MRSSSVTSHLARLIGALCLTALIACQPAAQSIAKTTPAATRQRPTQAATSRLQPSVPESDLQGLGIQVMHPWLGVEAGLLETQIAEFNQQNEWGITARAVGESGYAELFATATESLDDGSAPNVVIALPEHAIHWNASGHVVDLTNYVEDPAYGLTPEEVSDFPAIFWNQDSVAGARLGVPAQRSARLIAYNLSWARQLGFESPPRNELEFREQACSANSSLRRDDDPANDGQGGWIVDTHAFTFLSWMTAFGGGILDGGGYRFLGPRNLEALAYVKQLYDDGCAWLPARDVLPAAEFARERALFASASLEDLSEFSRAMAEAENTDTWTVLAIPGSVQPGIIVYGSSFVITKSTPEQQLAAWLFVRWMLSPERQRRWVEATGLFPLQTSNVQHLEAYARSHPQWEDAVGLLPDAQMQPQLASWRQIRVMIGDGFNAMFQTNTPAGRIAEILAIMDRTAGDLSQ